MRKERERFREMNADHLPVAGGGVLTRRRERAFSECRAGPVHGTDVRQRLQIAQAKLRHDSANAIRARRAMWPSVSLPASP